MTNKGEILASDPEFVALSTQVRMITDQVNDCNNSITNYSNDIVNFNTVITSLQTLYTTQLQACADAANAVIAVTPNLQDQALAICNDPTCLATGTAAANTLMAINNDNAQLTNTTNALNAANANLVILQASLSATYAALQARYLQLFSS